jgi:hypothetical protein
VRAEVELGLVVLYRETTQDIDIDQLRRDDESDEILRYTDPVAAIEGMIGNLDLETDRDRYAGALAFVLALRLHQQSGEDLVLDAAEKLGRELLQVFRPPGEASTAATHLVDAVMRLLANPEVSEPAQESLRAAFGTSLAITLGELEDTVIMSGPAAKMATMLTELAALDLRCHSGTATIPVDGVEREVTLVDIEICTHASFEACRKGIDPRHWPECSPYFQKVTVLGSAPPQTGSWHGVIEEVVGPALNGLYYTTKLAVSYVEQPGVVAMSFDLAADAAGPPPGDHRVSVDYGFSSVVDEGPHRRFRTLKVYRIEDMTTPHLWTCPLWAQQVVMAGWWC